MTRRHDIWFYIYIGIGIVVASSHGYMVALLTNLNWLKAIIAVLIWPLVALFGVDVHTWF